MSRRHSGQGASGGQAGAFYRSLTETASTFPPELLESDRMGVVTHNALVYPIGVTPLVNPALFDPLLHLITALIQPKSLMKVHIFEFARQTLASSSVVPRDAGIRFGSANGAEQSDPRVDRRFPVLQASVPLNRFDRKVFATEAAVVERISTEEGARLPPPRLPLPMSPKPAAQLTTEQTVVKNALSPAEPKALYKAPKPTLWSKVYAWLWKP